MVRKKKMEISYEFYNKLVEVYKEVLIELGYPFGEVPIYHVWKKMKEKGFIPKKVSLKTFCNFMLKFSKVYPKVRVIIHPRWYNNPRIGWSLGIDGIEVKME